jgi:hypothetical protein
MQSRKVENNIKYKLYLFTRVRYIPVLKSLFFSDGLKFENY